MAPMVAAVRRLIGPDVQFSTAEPLAASVLAHASLADVTRALQQATGNSALAVTRGSSLLQLATQRAERRPAAAEGPVPGDMLAVVQVL